MLTWKLWLTLIGVSRQFGFLEFSDIEVATTFLDQVYPSIRLYGRSNESTTINVAYSRDDRGHDGRNKSRDITWVCGNVTALLIKSI